MKLTKRDQSYNSNLDYGYSLLSSHFKYIGRSHEGRKKDVDFVP